MREGRKEGTSMSYKGEYCFCTDTWIFVCGGCGRVFEESDSISPLDGLGCCSAECDVIVKARFKPARRRSRVAGGAARKRRTDMSEAKHAPAHGI